ncbi:ROK family protein [Catenulispora acidiphila DSM 44928]|uniref:ROK family protein n=1 Tax=Catenulispora acidiphila (strain DSM 44928 / JCM 14897 / NBRC 102108 / NRRL B-24433 / ID139908) TaxID=479433 RepID=C7Q516_CATAD|nr:ROK family transcriptional regulator [Catenulispora acidiphila]ACU73964.1 ROK family protein [Catenulispora acidiphila DSM 44928]
MIQAGAQTTRDLRRRSRATLLSCIYLGRAVSRPELARLAGMSSAAVSNVVSDLISDGLVAEAGSVDSNGGRPRTMLAARPGFGYAVGVDIGETHIHVVLFDWTLSTLATSTHEIRVGRLDPDVVVRLVVSGVRSLLDSTGVPHERLLGIGIGVPGAVQEGERGVVHAPTLGWSGVPLGDALRAELDAPILIDNCARTLGQAEAWRGAGRDARRAVVALWGVGVGAAIAEGSSLAESGSSSTSEWGHAVIEARGRACRCGSHGCLEAYVGATAILDAYLAHPAGKPFTSDGTEAKMAELAARATTGADEAATATFDEAAEYLGIGVGNLINMINPDQVILAGWVGEQLGPLLMPAIREAARRHALPYLFDQTRIDVGELGPGAVALGAATLPVARLLAAGGHFAS